MVIGCIRRLSILKYYVTEEYKISLCADRGVSQASEMVFAVAALVLHMTQIWWHSRSFKHNMTELFSDLLTPANPYVSTLSSGFLEPWSNDGSETDADR